MYKFFFKRILDFIFALSISILLFPILAIAAMLLLFCNNGKPFFTQLRPGKNEKVFRLIKLKTMNDKKDGKGNLLSDAERMTTVGKFVRKTSIDELPQLFNVLKGDMALIGPRPLLVQYLPLYNDFQKRQIGRAHV